MRDVDRLGWKIDGFLVVLNITGGNFSPHPQKLPFAVTSVDGDKSHLCIPMKGRIQLTFLRQKVTLVAAASTHKDPHMKNEETPSSISNIHHYLQQSSGCNDLNGKFVRSPSKFFTPFISHSYLENEWRSQEFEAGGAQFPRSLRNVHETFTVDVGIAEAIGYLHNGTERCVVHRDIKPSNILLSSKRTPKMRNCLFS
ncbi:hypothetical protein LguiB_014393 [Lonicera macranthoides]